MLELTKLAQRLTPSKTVLFLGSGATVDCGGPTGIELAQYLSHSLATASVSSDDLVEVASILELRIGRVKVVEAIRARLKPLRPTGALLSLPDFGWNSIYTTNFDLLLETSYRQSGRHMIVVRSNFDYGKVDTEDGTPLFKIHGCLTQDITDGHKGRMTLTEKDYEEYSEFREVLFKRLSLDLLTKDILVVGHSLKDPHVKRDIAEAARLQKEKATGGNIFILLYERDDDRASLLEQKGLQVSFGSLDEFIHALGSPALTATTLRSDLKTEDYLDTQQRITTVDVAHAQGLPFNASALFHGVPASFADIRHGLTFERQPEVNLTNALRDKGRLFVVITGVAGVGKTTMGRRLLFSLSAGGFRAWEHNVNFPFRATDWLAVDKKLHVARENGVLLVDECCDSLRQINKLADILAEQESPALRVVLTANHAQWYPRIKSPALFRCGEWHMLSTLSEVEIDRLVNLLDQQPQIATLVDKRFHYMPRIEKSRHLSQRCSADMFVCLKNLFAFESLDSILLAEYSRLDEPLQEIYKHVAALDAAGAVVHRQLVLRLLSLHPSSIHDYLARLEGLVNEFDINPQQGVYGWRTRHEVIAQTIARYKFSDETEIFNFFNNLITHLNPTVWIEMRLIRDICNREYGIGRLSDPAKQCVLYKKLVRLVPAERVPRHRYVLTLIRMGDLNAADDAIRDAEDTVHLDPPLHRYKVLVKMRRATDTSGLAKQDKAAMLRDAERQATQGIDRFPDDKMAYRAYAQVGETIAKEIGDISSLDAALAAMNVATGRIADPHFDDMIRKFERERQSLRH